MHYGVNPPFGPPGDWRTLVRVILESHRSSKTAIDWARFDEAGLGDPGQACQLGLSEVTRTLEIAKWPTARAKALVESARWWITAFFSADPAEVVSAFRLRSLDTWRNELRSLPGVNWEAADRILLFVGGLPAFPLTRGVMRIVARHGWQEISAEYDDWQAFFASAARDADVDLAAVSQWSARVARDFCSRQPDCEACPLKSLLPARGVVNIETEYD